MNSKIMQNLKSVNKEQYRLYNDKTKVCYKLL